MARRGNCYVTCEALYHLLGGKAAGWKPMRFRFRGDTHWYLINVNTGQKLDPTAKQFNVRPPYIKGKGAGFLTKRPSKRAHKLMQTLLWQT